MMNPLINQRVIQNALHDKHEWYEPYVGDQQKNDSENRNEMAVQKNANAHGNDPRKHHN